MNEDLLEMNQYILCLTLFKAEFYFFLPGTQNFENKQGRTI